MEIHYESIQSVLNRIRTKQISAAELAEAQLKRLADLQPQLNAFVHVDAEGALRQGMEVDRKMLRGDAVGPLAGAPVTVKSCVEVSGWPTPAGSLLRKDEIPRKNAPIVQRLIDAGAIPLGNTNTPEFLMAYETDNRLSGKTSNPWNLAHSSGGSSGGEAAAIAAGISWGGIGSDGGGSIRVPAHFCGICGLKPTPGRIPATGHVPSGTSALGWLGVVGPMARTVGDVRLLFEAVAGADSGDAISVAIPRKAVPPESLRSLRIGVLESAALERATPETNAAVQRAARLLEAQGFAVEPFRLDGLERALDLWWFFFGTVIAELFEEMTRGKEHLLSSQFREYLTVAKSNSPKSMVEFVSKAASRDHERGRILRGMENVPVLLSPVSSGPAFRHGDGNWRPGAGYQDTMRQAQWLNLAGFPGLSIPMGQSQEGLPIGVQLIGRPFEEELLLTIGENLEEARGAWQAPRHLSATQS